MRKFMSILTITALAGCRPAAESPNNASAALPAESEPVPGWSLQRQAGGATLLLGDGGGGPVIRIACSGKGRLTVNVPAFRAIASEERMSFGGDGEVVALVAGSGGDKALGGVSAEGRIPDELKRLIIAPISASYGAQASGPHSPPPENLAGPFLTTCSELLTAARIDQSKPGAGTSPCLVQEGELLRMAPMRAIGTEPFWNARTEGRCVTYSTPEDQAGTRIWTRVGTGPMGPVWTGSFQGKPFVLRVQPAVRCSDGMSDKVYDWEAMLTVGGEERKGCAERP
jgi:uncharacterized membrane protein